MKNKLQNFVKGIVPKNVLFVMTVVCIGMMGITYLDADIAKPFRTVVGSVVIPLQKGINQIGTWGSDLFQKKMDFKALEQYVKELEVENNNLRAEKAMLQNALTEQDQMRELLELKDNYQNYEMTAATIIAKDDGSWYHRFTIDKGTNDGIKEGNNVIADDGGLVGIVVSASETYSIVRAIIDDSMNVSAMSQNGKELCMVSGDLTLIGEGSMNIFQIAVDSSIKSGTYIVTSNVSDRYLAGIPIGIVKKVTTDANQLTKSGYIKPIVNFKTLKDVLVILGTKEVESEK